MHSIIGLSKNRYEKDRQFPLAELGCSCIAITARHPLGQQLLKGASLSYSKFPLQLGCNCNTLTARHPLDTQQRRTWYPPIADNRRSTASYGFRPWQPATGGLTLRVNNAALTDHPQAQTHTELWHYTGVALYETNYLCWWDRMLG